MAAAGSVEPKEIPSVPQGWHASPTRTGASRPTTAVAPTVKPMTAPAPRRQWNVAQMTAPQRQQRRPKDGSSENERPSSASRALVERLRTEVAMLQRTVANFRVENQSLKAKAKRLEEENLRKARQVDKLVLASEHAKSVAAGEKKRDGEAMNLLKQKCAKLERSLKERENALRRIHSAEKRVPRTQASQATSPPQARKQTFREPPRKATGASALAADVELSRLRDALHRLTEENRRTAQHLREKEQEVRQLKLQLRQTTRETLGTRRAGTKSTGPKDRNRAGSATVETKQRQSLPKRSNTFNVGKRTALVAPAGTGAGDADSSGVDERKKSVGEPSTVAERSAGSDARVPAGPTNSAAEKKREQVAATKIQRTWRDHRKRKISKSAEASLEGSRLSNA